MILLGHTRRYEGISYLVALESGKMTNDPGDRVFRQPKRRQTTTSTSLYANSRLIEQPTLR
jgi:hypothetical protein